MASHYVSTPVRNNGRNWPAQERQSGPVSPGRVRQCAWQARGRRFESAMLHRKIEFRISTAVLFGTAFSLPTGQWTTIRTAHSGTGRTRRASPDLSSRIQCSPEPSFDWVGTTIRR
jgi:hypothetical protein